MGPDFGRAMAGIMGLFLLVGIGLGWVVWVGIPWLWHHLVVHVV